MVHDGMKFKKKYLNKKGTVLYKDLLCNSMSSITAKSLTAEKDLWVKSEKDF